MISFLIQSVLAMAVLLGLYHLLLQRENMHVFNRFFLLFAICFSFIIPFVQIEVAVENIPLMPVKKMVEVAEQPPVLMEAFDQAVPRINLLPVLTAFIYLVGVLIMLTRFIINLWRLRISIVKNKVVASGRSRLVLIDQSVLPHSFLNYIFISKKDFDNNTIEEELFQHESAHVRQKHSWDIIFLEIMLIISWFNPLLYLYRRAIKLNHEFLADESVLRINNNVPSYQQILLQKIFMNKASGLASHVHYSLTKKRLIMMTKSTSLVRGFLLKTLAMSFCAGLILTFCIKSVAQVPPPKKEAAKETQPTKSPRTPVIAQDLPASKKRPPVFLKYVIANTDSLRKVKDRYYGSRGEEVIYVSFRKGEAAGNPKRFSEMTQEEKDNLPPPPPVPKLKVPSQEQLDSWLDDKKFGVWINSKRVSNEELRNYKPADFGGYSVSKLEKNAINYGKHYFQVDLTTRDAFEENKASYIKLLGLDEKQ